MVKSIGKWHDTNGMDIRTSKNNRFSRFVLNLVKYCPEFIYWSFGRIMVCSFLKFFNSLGEREWYA